MSIVFSEEESPSDSPDWVEGMFADRVNGELVPLMMVAHDASGENSLGRIDIVPNSISILIDYASEIDNSNLLKDEHVIVLGGNRAGRSGRGRLYIPYSKLDVFVEYVNGLKTSLEQQIPDIVARIRAERTSVAPS